MIPVNTLLWHTVQNIRLFTKQITSRTQTLQLAKLCIREFFLGPFPGRVSTCWWKTTMGAVFVVTYPTSFRKIIHLGPTHSRFRTHPRTHTRARAHTHTHTHTHTMLKVSLLLIISPTKYALSYQTQNRGTKRSFPIRIFQFWIIV